MSSNVVGRDALQRLLFLSPPTSLPAPGHRGAQRGALGLSPEAPASSLCSAAAARRRCGSTAVSAPSGETVCPHAVISPARLSPSGGRRLTQGVLLSPAGQPELPACRSSPGGGTPGDLLGEGVEFCAHTPSDGEASELRVCGSDSARRRGGSWSSQTEKGLAVAADRAPSDCRARARAPALPTPPAQAQHRPPPPPGKGPENALL